MGAGVEGAGAAGLFRAFACLHSNMGLSSAMKTARENVMLPRGLFHFKRVRSAQLAKLSAMVFKKPRTCWSLTLPLASSASPTLEI